MSSKAYSHWSTAQKKVRDTRDRQQVRHRSARSVTELVEEVKEEAMAEGHCVSNSGAFPDIQKREEALELRPRGPRLVQVQVEHHAGSNQMHAVFAHARGTVCGQTHAYQGDLVLEGSLIGPVRAVDDVHRFQAEEHVRPQKRVLGQRLSLIHI